MSMELSANGAIRSEAAAFRPAEACLAAAAAHSGLIGVSSSGKSRVSSNSTMLSIWYHRDVGHSFEDELDSRQARYILPSVRAPVANAACASFGSVTRIALQPRPWATAT